jgi:hypothetical protein
MSLSLTIPRDAIFDSEGAGSYESLSISTSTWSRDSHDLFDYETSQTHGQHFRLAGRAMSLYRKGNDVLALPESASAPQSSEYLLSVRLDKVSGVYRVIQKEGVASKKVWSVIRANAPEGVVLREGLIIKLGRFKLRIRQICLKSDETDDKTSCSSYESPTVKPRNSDLRAHNVPDLRIGPKTFSPSFDLKDCGDDPNIRHLQCRICLCDGPGEDDPLICPCECTGSIRYVHSSCLGHWLKGRLGVDNYNGSVFFFRPMACELCHCVYPSYFESNGTLIPLASLPETRVPFIVFENLCGVAPVPAWNSDSSNTFPSGLHVVQLDTNRRVVKIGRGHECQMRISDVSISRLHALIRFSEDSRVYLEDQQSKFGTLVDGDVHKDDGLSLSVGDSLTLQSGRTLISLSVGVPSGSDQDTVNDTDMFEDALEDDLVEELRPQTY